MAVKHRHLGGSLVQLVSPHANLKDSSQEQPLKTLEKKGLQVLGYAIHTDAWCVCVAAQCRD
eukprot:588091-Amphidinium_carterae.1